MRVASYRVRSVALRVALAILFVLMRFSTSAAQVTSNPRTIAFTPFAGSLCNRRQRSSTGESLNLSVYEKGSQTPFSVVSLGNHSLSRTVQSQMDLVSVLPGWSPARGVTYDAQVTAVGPTGSESSDFSNDFSFSSTGPCTYSLSPKSASFAASGGQATLAVTTGASCTWSVSSDPAWITFNASGGTGFSNSQLLSRR